MNDLRKYRLLKKLRQTDVEELIGLSQATISRHEKGESKMDVDTAIKYSQIYDTSIDSLMSFVEHADDFKDCTHVFIPLLGEVCAGNGLEIFEWDDTEVIVPVSVIEQSVSYKKYKNVYAVRIKGESMNRVAPDKSVCLVEGLPDGTAWETVNKTLVVYSKSNEAAVKRYDHDLGVLLPESHDPTHKGIRVDETVRLLGRVRCVLGFPQ